MDLKSSITAVLILLAMLCCYSCFAKITIGVSSENGESLKYSRKQFQGELKSAYSCVINQLDSNYDVITVPQARLIKMLKNNEVDIAMPLLLLPTRDQFATRSATIYQVGYELISHSADPDLSIENLRTTTRVCADHLVTEGSRLIDGNGAKRKLEPCPGVGVVIHPWADALKEAGCFPIPVTEAPHSASKYWLTTR